MTRAIALAAMLVACRDNRPPAPPPAAPAPASSAPAPRPALPDIDAAVVLDPDATTQQRFAAEPVDPRWAQDTERDVHQRLQAVPLAPEVECRSTQCRITVVGSDAQLAHLLDQLAPLHAIAKTILLTAPEKLADGRTALHAYARFERHDGVDGN
ncbi:MAG TPA: hypothetical protein VLX92_08510 [Kofleriaceae bacterium]|nr:hypothetical protein [Kofleriaceae bacterium]